MLRKAAPANTHAASVHKHDYNIMHEEGTWQTPHVHARGFQGLSVCPLHSSPQQRWSYLKLLGQLPSSSPVPFRSKTQGHLRSEP